MALKLNGGTLLNEELNLATKITNLEERTANLEQEFDSIGQAAKELANAVKCYVDKVETERKSWDVIDSIMECGSNAYDIFNHIKIFFNFLLSKMAGYGANITDVTMLWHLYDKEGVHEMYLKAIKSFGFKEVDEDNIRLLLAVVYKQHIDMERECSARDVGTSEIAEQDNAASSNEAIAENDIDEDYFSKMLESDFVKLTLELHIVKVLKSLHLDETLKKVIKRAMAIVVYLLNVGRDDKILSIVPEKNVGKSQDENEDHGQLVIDA